MPAILAAFAVACSDGPAPSNTPKGGPDAPPPSVSVEPTTASIVVGETVQLSASVAHGIGDQLGWATSEPDVAAVSASGLVEGRAEGTAVVTATSGEASG
ncbi:MAG: Ig-like domain-containing protein, partial [Gemmatimonadales bacterium]